MASPLPAGRDLPVEVTGLTKRFGSVLAIDDLAFRAVPGRVTGFLGPNGSGKTTTLRCILGLVRPSAGLATIGGQSIRAWAAPAHIVGATLEAGGFHPGRTAEQHLRSLAAAGGIPAHRVSEVLQVVGLLEAANRRVGGFSLGMRQRLSLAGALLGDPRVLILDEPANGLDPEGIAWLRTLLRDRASNGCTILVSSHALGEIEQTADDVVIIANGRLRYAGTIDALRTPPATSSAATEGSDLPTHPPAAPLSRVRSPNADDLAAALHRAYPDATIHRTTATDLLVDLPPAQIGATALQVGAELHELCRTTNPMGGATEDRGQLETAFLRMTANDDPTGGPS